MTHAKYFALFGVLVLLALMVVPASAATLSITSVSIPTSVNLGESFTLTSLMSATLVNTGQAQLTLPSQISCTPASAQSVTLSSGSGSSSWNCTGNVAGDYSNKITVTVTDADGQAPQSTTQTGLTVLAPASITASASTSATSVDLSCGISTTFNYTIGVNNAGDIDASGVAMTPSPSGFTGYSLSPSSYSGQTVSAKSLKNFAFIVTVTQQGTLNFAGITVTSTNAGSDSTGSTLSVSVINSTSACLTTTTTQPNSGSTSPSTTPQPSVVIAQILAGSSATANFDATQDTSPRISAIKIAVKNTVTQVTVKPTKLDSLPASISVPPIGVIYKYADITATNVASGDIDLITISFQVEKAWATANNINPTKIAMNRYADGQWNKLPTTKTNEDSTYYYFNAESPGLSTFAITGEKVATTPTATPTATVAPTAKVPTPTPTATPGIIPPLPPLPPEGISIAWILAIVKQIVQNPVQNIVWILAIVVVIAVAIYLYQKSKKAPPASKGYSYQQKK